MSLALHWLPIVPTWADDLKALEKAAPDTQTWAKLVALANARLEFLQTNRLDRLLTRLYGAAPPEGLATRPIRLAVLGSSTLTHLLPGVRVAGLRRGLWITTYEPDYGQYLQELSDPASGLHAFRPDAVLFAFDAPHLTAGADVAMDAPQAEAWLEDRLAGLAQAWDLARTTFACTVLQQTALPVAPPLMGSNEHRLPGAPAHLIARFNARLRALAPAHEVDLVAVDAAAAQEGVRAWCDPVLWRRAKQEISPLAGAMYGELVARVLAARQGRSAKCLVLDLDNTLWGGVIGDDGLEGIVLGQGSALGEAFLSFQAYAKDLSRRGIILAVVSKNDEANALAAFDKHPEMLLRRADIACFLANWDDKAKNIRTVAAELNIGLDALVFVDDNPFERNLVRAELPMVGVPEIPEDPAFYAACLADAGYFEGLSVTSEDRERSAQYQANRERAAILASAADMPTYLRSLDMRLLWRRFDRVGLKRIVQLINKTNQFNLTTRRYTSEEVVAVIDDPAAFGLQLRLLDRFGDNGIIAIVIGRKSGEDVEIDTWLMSCRVLGRQVEQATLNLVRAEAERLGARRLIGEYRPTPKNGMVRAHYEKLGFATLQTREDGATRHALGLADAAPFELFMQVEEG